jgi:hypothetical protein
MPLSLKAFLSHRYKSPAVNGYFFELFAEMADLQFDVDRAKGPTNVTRLERLIRDADAFVGIYPFVPENEEAAPSHPTRQQLFEASAYFRLELALAARSRTPSIAFVDQRFGQMLIAPPPMLSCTFDHQEVTGRGGSSNRPRFQQLFARFVTDVGVAMHYEQSRPAAAQALVGFMLPPEAYDAALTGRLEALVGNAGLEVERVPWPPTLDSRLAGRLQSFDWVVADVGEAPAVTGLAGYLHGQFVPTLRLARQTGPAAAEWTASLLATLYGGHEVGYVKDLVRWSTSEELLETFGKRLARIVEESRRIGTLAEARTYFEDAARRKEAVFLSYTGDDRERVAPIAAELRKRFQSVFDYRDGGQSIEPGKAWLEQIYSKLDRSAVSVLMLSPAYLVNGNCAHEVRSAIAARDDGSKKMQVLPVKLGQDDLSLPPWLTDIQYLRASEFPTAADIVDRIVQLLR